MSFLSSLKFRVKSAVAPYLIPCLYYTIGVRFPKSLSLPYQQALQLLSNIRPQQESSCLCHNRITSEYDLHIIIPVYNSSAYLLECLDSVFQQETSYRVFVSIVDDGSTDGSNKVIREYINAIKGIDSAFGVELIEQPNQGLSSARNRALEHIRGKYVTFLDSDDRLLPGAIESLLQVMIKEDADIVEGNTQRGKTYGLACGKVYKSELFRNVHFPPGYLFEDTINIFFLYPLCRKSVQASGTHYYYRENPQSILHTFQNTPSAMDSLWVSKLVLEEYFSCGHQPTSQMWVDYLRDVLSTAEHLKTLQNEHCLQALFVVHCNITKTYFVNETDGDCRSCNLSTTLKLLAYSLTHNNYRLFRLIVR